VGDIIDGCTEYTMEKRWSIEKLLEEVDKLLNKM
jgi:hypothetical protein